ncbi:class I SAM-dependent methyltransferase [Pseudoroseicyclus tamaricis]|uniref:Class I SAM-dependent methyltransferase n=1 Tax=Pseudoroseicyclus tamaricis TaxID=2705421 RepID=A0A6B2JKE8_9RHOB|nr:class I SAM-dependent methyltransferase [Pseudoroseicyclus tamaricis]NDV01961.1 class I SAM-dependent methyltransferase [Pseudoroseicyclus tamaricis]
MPLFSRKGADIAHWEGAAEDWIAWARRPGHDAYWAYEPVLRAFIGAGAGAAIDIGCGEGRVSALLVALGYHVTAIDPVERMVAAAREKGSADAYAIAPAAQIPFASESFDLALMYNILTVLENIPKALAETRRLLRPDGRLVISVTHPFSERAEKEGEDGATILRLEEGYFGRERYSMRAERAGLRMDFAGWTQPLSLYTEALARAGFAITRMIEPQPSPRSPWRGRERWTKFPLFLWIEARPLG